MRVKTIITHLNSISVAAVLAVPLGGLAQINVGPNDGIGAGPYSSIAGGDFNTNKAAEATIGGGDFNLIKLGADYSFIGAGFGNTIISPIATIGGGELNLIGANGYDSFIGAGSGNQILSEYSSIGGGYGNLVDVASLYSAIAGGYLNKLSGAQLATIGGGANNIIKTNAHYATIAGGTLNTNRGNIATIGGGSQNTASGTNSTIPGGIGAVAPLYGQMAYASGYFAKPGDAQIGTYVLRGVTTSNVLKEIFLDGVGARLVVPTNTSWLCEVDILSRGTTKQNFNYGNSYHRMFHVENQSGSFNYSGVAAGGTLFGSTSEFAETFSDATAWAGRTSQDYSITYDQPTQSIQIKVKGANGETVRWVARVRTVELLSP